MKEFQIIPIDQDLISITCRNCNHEELVTPETQILCSDNDNGDSDSPPEFDVQGSDSLLNQQPRGATGGFDSDDDSQGAQNPIAKKRSKKRSFLGSVKRVAKPVFRTLWSIGRKSFAPVAKGLIKVAFPALGPVPTAAAYTAIGVISLILNSEYFDLSEQGDAQTQDNGIQEAIVNALPFLEEKALDFILKFFDQKSLK